MKNFVILDHQHKNKGCSVDERFWTTTDKMERICFPTFLPDLIHPETKTTINAEELKTAVVNWFNFRAVDFYAEGIKMLTQRLEVSGNYVEKWSKFVAN